MRRLFFAIDLPEELKEKLAPVTISLRELGTHVKPVGRSSFHLTLLFLGEQPEDAIPALIDFGKQAVSLARPCRVELGDVGFFPRVSFLKLVGEIETIAMISHALKESCLKYLEEPEIKPFQPHITVARHKQNIKPSEKSRITADFAPFKGADWIVESMILFESKLTPKGAFYSPVHVFPIAG